MENQTENKKPFPVVIIFPLVLFILLMAFFLLINRNNLGQEGAVQTVAESPTPTPIQEKGVLTLQAKDGKSAYSLNDVITLNVLADSDNQSMTGYDAVINYDPNIVKFVKQKSLSDEFQTFVQTDIGKVSVTGIKKLNSQAEAVFQDTPLAELTFQAIKAGNANFEIDFVPGSKKESNLIDATNKEVLGKVVGLELTIQ